MNLERARTWHAGLAPDERGRSAGGAARIWGQVSNWKPHESAFCAVVHRSIDAACPRGLESIARVVESVDASVPILCGIAANRLYALLGATERELPRVSDHPRTIARLLDRVAVELSGLDPDLIVDETSSLVVDARRRFEEA